MSGLRKRLYLLLLLAVAVDSVIGYYFYPKIPLTSKANYDFPVLAIFTTGVIICFVHMGLIPGLLAASYGKTKKGLINILLSVLGTIPCTVVGAIVSFVVGCLAVFFLYLIAIFLGGAATVSGVSIETVGKSLGEFVVLAALEISFACGATVCLLLARLIQNIVMKNEYIPSEEVVIWGGIIGALVSGLFLQKVWALIPYLSIATGISGLIFMTVWIALSYRKSGSTVAPFGETDI